MDRFPPRVTFRQSEQVGGIHLAPLAEFLSQRREARHLIKLADILERYRTPKSYHRYDFRIVDSSELPPSPGAWDDEELRQLWERERGSPIFVDDAEGDDGSQANVRSGEQAGQETIGGEARIGGEGAAEEGVATGEEGAVAGGGQSDVEEDGGDDATLPMSAPQASEDAGIINPSELCADGAPQAATSAAINPHDYPTDSAAHGLNDIPSTETGLARDGSVSRSLDSVSRRAPLTHIPLILSSRSPAAVLLPRTLRTHPLIPPSRPSQTSA